MSCLSSICSLTLLYEDIIYPEIPSAPTKGDQAQSYRLKKIEEAETFLRDEVLKRETLAKKFKCRVNATTISNTSIITAITGLEVASVVTLTTGVGIPISVALASADLARSIESAIIHKTPKPKNTIKSKSLESQS